MAASSGFGDDWLIEANKLPMKADVSSLPVNLFAILSVRVHLVSIKTSLLARQDSSDTSICVSSRQQGETN